MGKSWAWAFDGQPSYTQDEQAELERLEGDLAAHMEQVKPGRYAHSLSVAQTAEQMALAYGVSPFCARAAGILHDWDKVLSPQEQIEKAQRCGINLGVSLELVQPLLHGMTTAATLPEAYPQLPSEIWQAIERHTLGSASMSKLDMVLFVADGIEPRRKAVAAIEATRRLVEQQAPLKEVYWSSFYQGVAYVIETERYLYPGTLDIYNKLVLQRTH